jgi:hypothetical protein
MSNAIAPNLVGQRFTWLTVLQRRGSNPQGQALWLCQCGCGQQVTVTGVDLRRGSAKSCGCRAARQRQGWKRPGSGKFYTPSTQRTMREDLEWGEGL